MNRYEDGEITINECDTFAEFEQYHTMLGLLGCPYEDVGEGVFLYYTPDNKAIVARLRAPLDTTAPA